MRYVSRPVAVEAIQWNGKNIDEVKEFVKANLPYIATIDATKSTKNHFYIKFYGDFYLVELNDWILCGGKPSLITCSNEVFEENYVREEQYERGV